MCVSMDMVVIFIIICLTWFYVISSFAAHNRFEWSETFCVATVCTETLTAKCFTHRKWCDYLCGVWLKIPPISHFNMHPPTTTIAKHTRFSHRCFLSFEFIVFTSIKLKCLLIKISANIYTLYGIFICAGPATFMIAICWGFRLDL